MDKDLHVGAEAGSVEVEHRSGDGGVNLQENARCILESRHLAKKSMITKDIVLMDRCANTVVNVVQ